MPRVSTSKYLPTAGSQADYEAFWSARARENLIWIKDFRTALDWQAPYAEWFLGGKLNASSNCLDRHVGSGAGSRVALRWQGDRGDTAELTYQELLEQVCRLANAFKHLGIERGDRVAIYLPEIPQLVVAMLACARIGAVHSVIHCSLSSDSLSDRINDATAVLLITADGYYQGGEFIDMHTRNAEALRDTPSINEVIIVRRSEDGPLLDDPRTRLYDRLLEDAESACRPEPLASEELLFLLYTPGATGRPKGIMHTTAGYLTQVAVSHGQVFQTRPDRDVFWCTIGTALAPGHSYGVYGALLNGMCTLLCESALDVHRPERFWDIVGAHGVSQVYVSPAMLRNLMALDADGSRTTSLPSLCTIATFGSPLPIRARRWLSLVANSGRISVVDTWWQTETGAVMLSGAVESSDETWVCSLAPLPGIEADVVDDNGDAVASRAGQLVIRQPWPAMLRGVWDAPLRYRQVYWSGPPGVYCSGDQARRLGDGGIRPLGRDKDLIRDGERPVAPIEIEDLLNGNENVSESVVVGVPEEDSNAPDRIVGFAILETGVEASDELAAELADFVAQQSQDAVKPDRVLLVPDLPKTSDGKYMRRLLRNVAAGSKFGDTSALADRALIDEIRARAAYPENWCWNNGPFEPGRIAIVDIDGVIADAYDRMRGLGRNFPRNEKYFTSVEKDDVVEEVTRLLDLFSHDIRIVLLSARPLRVQDTTVRWLRRHGVRWDLLILRATSSMQLPVNHKRHRTQELLKRGFQPVIALEDDPRNVEMFQEEGIPCLYVHSRIHTEPGE